MGQKVQAMPIHLQVCIYDKMSNPLSPGIAMLLTAVVGGIAALLTVW